MLRPTSRAIGKTENKKNPPSAVEPEHTRRLVRVSRLLWDGMALGVVFQGVGLVNSLVPWGLGGSVLLLGCSLAALILRVCTSKSMGKAETLLGLVLLAQAIFPYLVDVPFPASGQNWLMGHCLVIGMVSLHPHLRASQYVRALTLVCIASLATFLAFGDSALSVDDRSLPGWDGRLRGVLGHPNVTGLGAAVLLCLSPRLKSWVTVIAVCTLLATGSLSGMTAAAIGLTCRWVSRKWQLPLIAVAASVSVIPFLMVRGLWALPASDFVSHRGHIWQWLNGIPAPGRWGYGIEFFSMLKSQTGDVGWVHAHNEWVMRHTTGGLILVCLGVSLVAIAVWCALRHPRGPAPLSAMLMAAAAEVPFTIAYPGPRSWLVGLVLCVLFLDSESNRVE